MSLSFIMPWEREAIIRRMSDEKLLTINDIASPAHLGYDIVVDELERRTKPDDATK